MATKIIALDIYGTVLNVDFGENKLPLRKGLEAFISSCKSQGIKIICSSGEDADIVKQDLKESGFDISLFDDFYQLDSLPKNFSLILRDYKVLPEELFVIGDHWADFQGAIDWGARFYTVPRYFKKQDDFDLSSIVV